MKYEKLTKKQLLEKIAALERLANQLFQEQQQESSLDFSWSGNLGHWYWDIPTNNVTFNPLKLKALGFDVQEVKEPIGYDFFTSRLHPNDYERVMENMRSHLRGDSHVYEVEYRIQAKDGTYKWFYDRGAITKRDDNGLPLLLSGIVFDITSRKEFEARLEEEKASLIKVAMTDEMTGAMNYRGIMNFMKEFYSNNEDEINVSLLMIDIDDFKLINDTYGHPIGNSVMQGIVSLIEENLRPIDRLGRFGGDEFVIILPHTSKEKAYSIGERIRSVIAEHEFPNHLKITISGGVYEFQGATIYDLIRQADINLYEAKRQGKNRII